MSKDNITLHFICDYKVVQRLHNRTERRSNGAFLPSLQFPVLLFTIKLLNTKGFEWECLYLKGFSQLCQQDPHLTKLKAAFDLESTYEYLRGLYIFLL